MKYSNQHDEKAFTIDRGPEDDEILANIDTSTKDTVATLKGGKRDTLTEKRDGINTPTETETDAPEGSALQEAIMEEKLRTLKSLFEEAPDAYRKPGGAGVSAIQLHIQRLNEEITRLRAQLREEEEKQGERGGNAELQR